MPLVNISRYRTEIMGIAILWIILYHSTHLNFGNSPFSLLLNSIKTVGYGGADLFFFLSGFGLVFGWFHKKYKVCEFYRKRLFRILPTYWTALLLYLIVHLVYFHDFKVRGFIADLLGLGFLTSHSYNYWFVPSIIICYLIFPAIILLLSNSAIKEIFLKNFWSIMFLATCLPLVLLLVATLEGKYQLLIFFVRLPNFIAGVVIGFLYFKGKMQDSKEIGMNASTTFFVFIVGILLLWVTNSLVSSEFSWRYGLLWLPFVFLTFPLCLTLALSLDWLNNKFPKCSSLPRKCLLFCGAYSLEIYLTHVIIFDFYDDLRKFVFTTNKPPLFNQSNLLTYIALTISSLLFAFLIKKFISLISKVVNYSVALGH